MILLFDEELIKNRFKSDFLVREKQKKLWSNLIKTTFDSA